MRYGDLLSGILKMFAMAWLAIGLVGVTPAGAQPIQDTTRLIVKYKSAPGVAVAGTNAAPLAASQMQSISAAAGMPLNYVRPMATGAHVLNLPVAMTQAEASAVATSISKNMANIEYAEPDARMYPMLVPNDPLYANQWHYDVSANHGMNLPGAWDVTTGSTATVVAVIDTGILAHGDFDAARILPGYDMISDINVANDGDARDPYADDPGDWITSAENASGYFAGCPIANSSWHGTHVAGTIAANTNNSSGVAGINWNAKILPVRVLGKCGGYTSDIVDGMSWAAGLSVPGVPANPNPADVMNLSLGGTGACSTTYQNAIDAIVAAGKTVVVAAGNNAADASGYQPASCNNVITVAAHNNASIRSWYSNFGTTVEIMAPGGETTPLSSGGVYSTLDGGTTVPLNDDVYAWYQGTSMAAPHVAGLASLMLAVDPALDSAQITAAIQNSSRAFVGGSDCALNPGKCGTGIADAYAAVNLVSASMPVAPTTLAGTPVSSTQIDLTWTDNSNNETGFKIERKVGAGGVYAKIATVAANATGYSDVTAAAETDYFYRIRAFDSYANSLPSNGYNGVALAAPSALGGTLASETQVDLSWTDNSAIETGFTIERKIGAGAFAQVGTVAANVTTYTDNTVPAGTGYGYRVMATNASGNSSYSSVSSGVALAAPSVLTATSVSKTQVDLSWTDNSASETGFTIERKIGAGAFAQIGTVAANATTYSDSTVSAGTGYGYRVMATNASGNSSYSNVLSATTPAAVVAGGGGGGGCLIASPQTGLNLLLMLLLSVSAWFFGQKNRGKER